MVTFRVRDHVNRTSFRVPRARLGLMGITVA